MGKKNQLVQFFEAGRNTSNAPNSLTVFPKGDDSLVILFPGLHAAALLYPWSEKSAALCL